MALIPVDKDRRLVGEPQLVSRGFVYLNEAEELLSAAQKEIKRQYKRGANGLRRVLEDFFYRETHSRPVVLPHFVNV